MNNQNLRKPQSTSEAREWGHNGGVKSGQVRRERKAVRDVLKMVLAMPVTNEAVLKDIKKFGLPLPEDPTYLDYIVSSIVIRTARRGQMSDLERLMGILGEEYDTNSDALEKVRELLDTVPSVID